MSRSILLAAILLTCVLAVAGCGNSAPSQASIRHCWSVHLGIEATLMAALNGTTARSLDQEYVANAPVWSEGKLSAVKSTLDELDTFRAVKAECGAWKP